MKTTTLKAVILDTRTGHLATLLLAQEAKAQIDQIPIAALLRHCRTYSATTLTCSSQRRSRWNRRSLPGK